MNEEFLYNSVSDFSSNLEGGYFIAFLPLYGISVDNKIELNDFRIYPKFRMDESSFNIESLFKFSFDELSREEKLEKIREKEKEIFDVFSTHTILAFPFKIDKNEYLDCDYEFEVALLKTLSDSSEIIGDLIRYSHCNYFDNFKKLVSPGYCRNGFSTALVLLDNKGTIKVHAGQFLQFVPSVEANIKLDNAEKLQDHPLVRNNIKGTGNIAKNALLLNSMIINSESNNSKFVLIMQLIDFLMLPYEYANFKRIKGNFISRIAKSKEEYHMLSQRFKELTGPDGIRTKIIHGGYNIEELLPYNEIENLFNELHKYIIINIDALIENHNIEFDEFQELTNELKEGFM